MDHKPTFTFERAEEYLTEAKEQLCKPEEDVVAYSVCKNAYHAIAYFLGSHLHQSEVSFDESASVEELLMKCQQVDARFHGLKLDTVYQPTENEHIWMDVKTATGFVELAEETRQVFVTVQ
jgi:hypothetical protein